MKRLVFLLFFSITNIISAQEKDLDQDGVPDSVYFDTQKLKIICKLSSLDFKPIYSKEIETSGDFTGVSYTKNGFEFYIDFMRAGYSAQFRYEPKDKTIRLIGMSRYEFGPANNDGSGESSVNLLTDDYIGEWNYYDLDKSRLIKMPTIITKLTFKKTFLIDFDESVLYDFGSRCSELYLAKKEKLIHSNQIRSHKK
ncbi:MULTISPECIES: hypothetical protein [Chryseobacterium]|uniref:Uncharacterized protein n=2 Tax=Chryseobacterium TaxID=59732 RepID=A0A3D9BFT4_9FLAO|nr:MULTISPECIES: hypothetical protein [Chryseobacterium]OVE58519.1 hypothetical protein B0E34_07495 [Chryseobacterium mucoviscidosis]REC52403.1 hypothetical protein DRF68_03495 [Candidatus Chryseobacterium massiliae]